MNAPGPHRLRLPRRGAGRSCSTPTRQSRSSSSRACASRSSSSCRSRASSSVEVDELPESERGVRGFGSSRVECADASRGSASRRSCAGSGRILLCRHEKAETRALAAPGRRRQLGREPRRRAASRAGRGGRHRATSRPGRRAGGDRRLDRAGARFAAKHVVHIIFAGDLSGRSLEAVTSQDAAVRGHRLFALGRARRDRAAPADPALPSALAARVTRRCTSGALWAP